MIKTETIITLTTETGLIIKGELPIPSHPITIQGRSEGSTLYYLSLKECYELAELIRNTLKEEEKQWHCKNAENDKDRCAGQCMECKFPDRNED